MATRRDELNAYSFARKRTVAAFLQPSPHGSEEAAPRPLKTVGPSLVVALMVVVGFGAWGVLKPTAPKGWDAVAEKVIVGDESTTRYVVLNTKDASGKKTKQLHPILNLASAKLLLDPQKFGVVKVKESVLDTSGIQHGATIGIPYAPDRLPGQKDAETRKYWALCETPGGGSEKQSQKAVFVLNKADQGKVENRDRLTDKEAMYVEGPDGAQYLVSSQGGVYLLGGQDWKLLPERQLNLLRRVIFGETAQPQKVSSEWLGTLIPAGTVDFPVIDGVVNSPSTADLISNYSRVGLILQATSGNRVQKYVVLKDRVAPVSDFTAQLLLNSPQTDSLYGTGVHKPVEVPASQITPDRTFYYQEANWPSEAVEQANTQEEGTGRDVACTVYHGKNNDLKTTLPEMSMWAGKDFPIKIAQTGTNTYVSSGSGLLYRQVTGSDTGIGSIYLVTDTGLRYSVPATNDSTACGASTEENSKTNTSQIRLGYEKNAPVPVPQVWSQLLASGPTLATEGACQAQGS